MPTHDPPFSPSIGSVLVDLLLQLTEQVRALAEAQARRERQLQQLAQRIDRFLDGELELASSLAQVRQVVGANRDAIYALDLATRDLTRTIDGVLDLALSDPLEARAFGA